MTTRYEQQLAAIDTSIAWLTSAVVTFGGLWDRALLAEVLCWCDTIGQQTNDLTGFASCGEPAPRGWQCIGGEPT